MRGGRISALPLQHYSPPSARHTDGWDGGDDFTELQLVEDGRLSGGVETDHENAHLLLSP